MRHFFLICDRERPLKNSQVVKEYKRVYLQMQNMISGKVCSDMGFCYTPQFLAGVYFGMLDPPWLSALDPVNQPGEVS